MQLLENCPSLEDDYPPSLKKGASAPFFFALLISSRPYASNPKTFDANLSRCQAKNPTPK